MRVLLCLGLLVNGYAQAMAVTQTAIAGHRTSHAAPPCHDTGAMQASMAHLTGEQPRSGSLPNAHDCCKAGVCDVACGHVMAGAPAVYMSEGRSIVHVAHLASTSSRYASPALPRLVRPPIV